MNVHGGDVCHHLTLLNKNKQNCMSSEDLPDFIFVNLTKIEVKSKFLPKTSAD